MTDKEQHLERASQNEWLANTMELDDPIQADWAVVMLFYSALHYIDCFLAGKNCHPRNHDARDAAIEHNGTITVLYKDYRRLKDASREARYDFACYDKPHYSVFENRFKTIKNFILQRV